MNIGINKAVIENIGIDKIKEVLQGTPMEDIDYQDNRLLSHVYMLAFKVRAVAKMEGLSKGLRDTINDFRYGDSMRDEDTVDSDAGLIKFREHNTKIDLLTIEWWKENKETIGDIVIGVPTLSK